jgi:hypothetical protein
MKLLFYMLMIIMVGAQIVLAANGYWDNMTWDHENWYIDVGDISGQIKTDVTGQNTIVIGATVTVVETGQSAISDNSGNYSISDIPIGNYTVKIQKEGFEDLLFTDISLSKDDIINLPIANLTFSDCGMKGDFNDDEIVDLKEAIHALQVVTGTE